MAKTTSRGKGLAKAKGKRETSKESIPDGSGSETEQALRRRILDETRQDPVDAVEAGGSGVGRQDEDVDAVDDDDNVDDDDGDTETAEEEAVRKKREEAAKKKEAAAKKKAVEKKA